MRPVRQEISDTAGAGIPETGAVSVACEPEIMSGDGVGVAERPAPGPRQVPTERSDESAVSDVVVASVGVESGRGVAGEIVRRIVHIGRLSGLRVHHIGP